MTSRSPLTLLALVVALAAWPAAALAGDAHGSPPGQEKKTTGSASAHANAQPPGQSQAHGQARAHLNARATVHGTARVRARAKVTAHGHANLRAGAAVSGRSQASADASAHAKVPGQASVGVGVGVKPSSTTAKDTFAAAASNQTKLYGNGMTAGEIALMFGAQADTMLFGPGNSQPHKVSCGARWIDVHALKAHAAACAGASGSEGASAQTGAPPPAKVSGNGVSGRPSAGVLGVTRGSTGAQGQAGAGVNAGAGGVLGASATTPGNRSSFVSGVLGAAARTGTLPFTGAPLWIAALLAAAVLATGLGVRRAARARA